MSLKSQNSLLSIIYDKNRYNTVIETMDMSKADIITDVIENVDDGFKWMKQRLYTLESIRLGYYNDTLDCVIDKSTLLNYHCDFSSICELGLCLSSGDIQKFNKYKYHYTLDLDDNHLRFHDNDNEVSIALNRKDLDNYLAKTLFKVLF
jgi:hypothetical protein